MATIQCESIRDCCPSGTMGQQLFFKTLHSAPFGPLMLKEEVLQCDGKRAPGAAFSKHLTGINDKQPLVS